MGRLVKSAHIAVHIHILTAYTCRKYMPWYHPVLGFCMKCVYEVLPSLQLYQMWMMWITLTFPKLLKLLHIASSLLSCWPKSNKGLGLPQLRAVAGVIMYIHKLKSSVVHHLPNAQIQVSFTWTYNWVKGRERVGARIYFCPHDSNESTT